MKKSRKEHVFVMFDGEQELLYFYANLPKRAKKRLRLFQKWHAVSMLIQDYDRLKDRIEPEEKEEQKKRVTVESDIQYKVHALEPRQKIPWGVARVQAPKVWNRTKGEHIKVGIIDTGIDGTHPDLRGNIAGGVNTMDSSNPLTDPNGHGTHVAGIIAALNNKTGVVGVSPKACLYSLKAFDEEGAGSLTDIAQAIDWAIDNNIRILNMSFGSRQTSRILHRAIKAALRAGILMIASAGNSAETLDYPALHAEVLAVGAVNEQNRIASFSNFGQTLNYVEPGVNILSTWPVPPGYNTLSGTSMAAPHLTGLCALLLSRDPDLTPRQIKQLLDRAAIKLPGIPRNRQGRGMVVAPRLLEEWKKNR